jgi:hypothetical protein
VRIELRGSTKEQRIKLAVLVTLLAAVIFWPSVGQIAKALGHPTQVRIGSLQVKLPRIWLRTVDAAVAIAWLPNMTILTSGARASIRLEILAPDLPKDDQIWDKAARVALAHFGFKDEPTRRTLSGEIGSITCLEVSSPDGRSGSTCFEPVHGFMASFEGRSSHLQAFQAVITSVHALRD